MYERYGVGGRVCVVFLTLGRLRLVMIPLCIFSRNNEMIRSRLVHEYAVMMRSVYINFLRLITVNQDSIVRGCESLTHRSLIHRPALF